MLKRGSGKTQQGVGLIEVMVTVLLLSTSLLALAALQNRSLQFNHEAYLRSQANILAYDIIDRVRVNRSNATDYSLDFGDDATGSSLADTDLKAWSDNIAETLPGGEGEIECVAATEVCTVSLRWVEADIADAGDNGEGTTTTFTYQTRF